MFKMPQKPRANYLGRKTVAAQRAKLDRLKESPVQTDFRKRVNAIKREAKREADKRVGESNFQSREKLDAQEECQAMIRVSQSLFRSQRHLNREAKQQASNRMRKGPEKLQAKRTSLTHMIAAISNDLLQNPRSLPWSTLCKLFARVRCPKSYHICTIRKHLVYRIGGHPPIND